MTASAIRRVHEGVAERRQMVAMFDRRARRPHRFADDAAALYRGAWFEIGRAEHDSMFEVLPPLWLRGDMVAMRELPIGSITSVVVSLSIDGRIRSLHGHCDLVDRTSPEQMRDAIIERESRPLRAMTRTERLEQIWSSSHDDARGYADERFASAQRGKRIVMMGASRQAREFKLLDHLTAAEISARLPVHLRDLSERQAA